MSTPNNLFWKLILLFIFGLDASKSTWGWLSSLAIQYNSFQFRKHFKFSVTVLAGLLILEFFLCGCPTGQQVIFFLRRKSSYLTPLTSWIPCWCLCAMIPHVLIKQNILSFLRRFLKTNNNIELHWQPTTNSRKADMKAKGINKVATPKLKSLVSICNKRRFATKLVL